MVDFTMSACMANALSGVLQPEDLLATNTFTQPYGLVLTPTDAKLLVQEGQSLLQTHDRVEIGDSILPKLIEAFAPTGYLPPHAYAETLSALLDLFYQTKNETFGLLADERIVAEMARLFADVCHGAVDLLADQLAQGLCQAIQQRVYQVSPDPEPSEDTEDDADD